LSYIVTSDIGQEEELFGLRIEPDYERKLNEEIDLVLKNAGYKTFLAQNDGFLYLDIVEEMKFQQVENPEKNTMNLIYHLDMFQVCEVCDATILNMNGRVPDEGALVEAALAYRSEKPVVIYKSDSRSLIDGKDNPLITGMTNMKIVKDLADITIKLRELEKTTESTYSIMIKNAEAIFQDYNPNERDLKKLVSITKRVITS